jgi:hypothetical protein
VVTLIAFGRRPLPALVTVTLALGFSSCGEVPERLGATPAEARALVAGILDAVAARFGPVVMESDLEDFRPRLAQHSFAPSRIFDDPAWVVGGDAHRRIGFWGRREGKGYRLGLAGNPPPLARASDYRGELELWRQAEDQYEWRWLDELSLGRVPPDFVAALLGSVFLDAASGEEDLAGWLRRAAPRTAASLGRLVRLVRLDPTLQPDGATHVGVGFVFEPARIREEFPAYARYLERFFEPIQMNLQVYDEERRRWWGLDQRDLRIALRFRVYQGRLAPLEDPPRRMPERLRVQLSLTTRSGLFRVGFENLRLNVRLTRTPAQKAMTVEGREPPHWRIPFLVKPLMRSALDRPFHEEGLLFGAGVRAGEDGLTRIELQFRFTILESWIVRRMGGFVASASSEFREKAEEEANRFQGEVLEAFRDDVEALLRRQGVAARRAEGVPR